MANSHANDAMIRRLEKELEERNSAAQAIISNVQDLERDLNDSEKETLSGLRDRMGELKSQLTELEATAEIASQTNERLRQLDKEISSARKIGSSVIEYRSAGHYALEAYKAHIGDREAAERLETFYRAADHQKTPDNLGVVPDPIVGDVLNFIDAARPIVSILGPQSMPSATWHRPKVEQHAAVAAQGANGAAADEKAELVSQKMTITRLTANAKTFGGYVNVSRQNIDFSSPQVMDLVINDLAAQYSIETEADAAQAMLSGATGTPVSVGTTPDAASIASGLWEAAGAIYDAVRGQGRLVLAVSPTTLGTFGPLFAPVSPRDAQSMGFDAGQFGQGVMGAISGISLVMSSGLTGTEAILFSTASTEVFEQRVGSLQVTEPSVLGVQVAYAGYFTPLLVAPSGIVEITQTV